jgi:hypothetical protein
MCVGNALPVATYDIAGRVTIRPDLLQWDDVRIFLRVVEIGRSGSDRAMPVSHSTQRVPKSTGWNASWAVS